MSRLQFCELAQSLPMPRVLAVSQLAFWMLGAWIAGLRAKAFQNEAPFAALGGEADLRGVVASDNYWQVRKGLSYATIRPFGYPPI